MKKFKRIQIYFLLLFLFLSGNLKAEDIGLLPFKLAGIESNITEAIYQLLKSELSSYGHTVTSPDKIEEKLGERVECDNKKCAAEIGIQMGLDKVIFGAVTKLGEKYIVSAVVVESQTGEIVFSDKVTSATPEDLDVCLSRLVKSIEEGKEVEKTVEVGKITEEEIEKGAKRKKAFFSWGGGIGIGTLAIGYGDAQGDIINYYIGKAWYETPKFAAEVNSNMGNFLGLGFEDETKEWSFGIALLYFFSTADFSPYLGAGPALKSISTNYFDYDYGLALELIGGLVVFRTYDFRVVIDGRLSTFFNDIEGIDGPHSTLSLGVSVLYSGRRPGGGCFVPGFGF
jgi:hypothetical protein